MEDVSANRRVHLIVSGRVQGVAFRAHTKRAADSLGVTGRVRNLPSGQVEIVAEGSPGALDELVLWAHSGPSLAHVESVEIEHQPLTREFRDFRVQ